MDLTEFKTTDLIIELIKRGITRHDFELIYDNTLNRSMDEYQERERERHNAWVRAKKESGDW